MNAPQVSVVLPTFNRAALLPRAARSVLAQSFADLELIVVDDGSTDDTESCVRALNDPRVIYHRRAACGGVSAARNAGVGIARGEFIAFQDSDDEWLPEKLERQMQVMSARGARCGMVGCSLLFDLGEAVMTVRWPTESGDRTVISPRGLVAGFTAHLQTALFRKECLQDIGAFDEALRLSEDWELVLRAVGRWDMGNVAEPLAMMYATPDSLTSHKDRRSVALRKVLERHRGLLVADAAVHSRFLVEIAKGDIFAGDFAAARRALVEAMGKAALNWRAWTLYAATFVGGKNLHRMIRAYRAIRLRCNGYR